ncbi:MAG: nucleoside triphosphate pyrophosphohydrolase [Pseudomonadota bacterium]
MQPGRDVSRLVEIMAALRTPDSGCPWDLEQTFRSIAPYTIEETYEVVDAIERNDMENLREELGDLLLQVVYHARMAEELGAFNFADVVEGVTTKMVRRHPHVFGPEAARTAGMAKGTWERIKAAEKAERAARRAEMGLAEENTKTGVLDDVPAAMPPFLEALKLQQRAAKVGFDWNDPRAVIAKVREELDEFEAELDADDGTATARGKLEDELGDTLFTYVNLARHLDLDAEAAVRATNQKFRRRVAHIEKALADQGRTLGDADLDEMEALWQAAKNS